MAPAPQWFLASSWPEGTGHTSAGYCSAHSIHCLHTLNELNMLWSSRFRGSKCSAQAVSRHGDSDIGKACWQPLLQLGPGL